MTDLIFLEFQFSKFGAMINDQLNIKKGLTKKFNCEFRNYSNPNILFIINNLRKLAKQNKKIIFLSSKLWKMFIISILFRKNNFGFVYHFIPHKRFLLHKILIYFMKKNIVFASHSKTLCQVMKKKFNIKKVYFVPSFMISLNKKTKKLKKNYIFLPKISNKKNVKFDINKIFDLFEKKKIEITKIYSQVHYDKKKLTSNQKKKLIIIKPNLNKKSYDEILKKVHYIFYFWDREHEIRCSGSILSAISNHIFFITNNNLINKQYGLNKTLVTNYLAKYKIADVSDRFKNFFKYYPDSSKYGSYWSDFIKNIK